MTTWIEEMASEANQLAAALVGMPDDDVADILHGLREQVASTLSAHLGRKRASIVAGAFTRLVQGQRGEFIALGFVDQGESAASMPAIITIRITNVGGARTRRFDRK